MKDITPPTLSFSDCVQMMEILQHEDVKRCFANTTIQNTMEAQYMSSSVVNVLRTEKCMQKLLTNTDLIKRIAAMHVKMHSE